MEKIHASKLLAGLVPAGFLTSDPEVELVTTDSREVRPGCIFVAFPGERFDGHDFAAKALEEGAVFVVVFVRSSGQNGVLGFGCILFLGIFCVFYKYVR